MEEGDINTVTDQWLPALKSQKVKGVSKLRKNSADSKTHPSETLQGSTGPNIKRD